MDLSYFGRKVPPGACRSLALAVLLALAFLGRAEDKKEEKKSEPLSILLAIPLGITRGQTNLVTVRGLGLTNIASVTFQDTNLPVRAVIVSQKKAEVPKPLEAKKVGDTQLEISFEASGALPLKPIRFRVADANGVSALHSLLVFDPALSAQEKEPNGGFRAPQKIAFPGVITGSIQEPNDVDVFQFEGKAGTALRAEIQASRLGSPLDPLLSLYDSAGHLLATADDDAESRDPTLKVSLPRDGIYFLSVMDAHDQGGPAHVYALELRGEKRRDENLFSKPEGLGKLVAMRPQTILPKGSPKPVGPYSHAVRVGDLLFCSGQIPINPATGDLITGDIKLETAQVLENIRTILDQEGLSFRNIVKSTVFLLNLNDFAAINEVYGRYFTGDFPARSTVQVSGLPRGARVEIEVIAHYSTP